MPADASRAERKLARRAVDRMIAVMELPLNPKTARAVFTAAQRIREEIRGGTLPQTTRVEGPEGSGIQIVLAPFGAAAGRPASTEREDMLALPEKEG